MSDDFAEVYRGELDLLAAEYGKALARSDPRIVDTETRTYLPPGDGGLRGSHRLRDLFLRHFGLGAGLDQGRRQREFVLQGVVGVLVRRVFRPGPVQFVELRHVTSLALCRAISSSRCGVFCVFFTKAGVRRTERAWLAYRDAFVAFAATLDAPGAVDVAKGELTRRRAADLEALLAD